MKIDNTGKFYFFTFFDKTLFFFESSLYFTGETPFTAVKRLLKCIRWT